MNIGKEGDHAKARLAAHPCHLEMTSTLGKLRQEDHHVFTAAVLQNGNLPQRKPISLMAQVVRARVGKIERDSSETNSPDCINHCHASVV